jgi:hypothetical protein
VILASIEEAFVTEKPFRRSIFIGNTVAMVGVSGFISRHSVALVPTSVTETWLLSRKALNVLLASEEFLSHENHRISLTRKSVVLVKSELRS